MFVVKKISKPNPAHAACLSKLFPASMVTLPDKGKTKSAYVFDPTDECVNIKWKRQKKGAITRSRPYKLWVVGSDVFPTVAKAGTRRKMKKDGRVKQVEFSRILSKQEVKNVLLRNFPTLRLTRPTFMKANVDNHI